jgi:hypothetical protein
VERLIPLSHGNPQLIGASFPAFDQSGMLIGFYRETMDSRGTTTVSFVDQKLVSTENSTNHSFVANPNEALALERKLQERLRDPRGNQAVFQLPNCLHDLEKMKQEFIVYYWLSEATI